MPCADTQQFGSRWFEAGAGRGRFREAAHYGFGARGSGREGFATRRRPPAQTLAVRSVPPTGARELAATMVVGAFEAWKREPCGGAGIAAWVRTDGAGLSFDRCCSALDADPDVIREAFQRIRPLTCPTSIARWAVLWEKQGAVHAARAARRERRRTYLERAVRRWAAARPTTLIREPAPAPLVLPEPPLPDTRALDDLRDRVRAAQDYLGALLRGESDYEASLRAGGYVPTRTDENGDTVWEWMGEADATQD